MRDKQTGRNWSLGAILGAATSVVCMGSMGAMGVVAGASAAATAATGVAGMGAMAAGAPGQPSFTKQLLQAVGLGVLTQIPDAVLRPLLFVLLLAGIGGAYLAYRFHHHLAPLLLTIVASVLLYVGIYVISSDQLYYVGLSLLLAGGIWGVLARPVRHHEQAANS
ncbi:MAG: hypothetical protein DLM69_08645 [Candidatus Chloroheliales bacterium]|nr:MAG: hypothetical protein DLM69_08645 [Chloroflexota bacterium]